MYISDLIPYINQVSYRLEGFKQSRAQVWNARCPICGDSFKRKSIKRFYIHPDVKHQTLMASCRNCNYANSFLNFLKDYHNDIYGELIYENFKRKGDSDRPKPVDISAPVEELTAPVKGVLLELPLISELPEIHPIVRYLQFRKIFKFQWDRLSYCDNFKEQLCDLLPQYQNSEMPTDARLIIPFYDETGVLTHIQGRSLDDSAKVRYITLKIDEKKQKLFGAELLDHNKPTYVVEGPIDSLFLPNCVATADSNLLSCTYGDVYIPDNQMRNKDIVRGIDSIIDAGKSVVLFPEEFIHKDINDALKAGVDIGELYRVIRENTFYGLQAELKWSTLCKIKRTHRK